MKAHLIVLCALALIPTSSFAMGGRKPNSSPVAPQPVTPAPVAPVQPEPAQPTAFQNLLNDYLAATQPAQYTDFPGSPLSTLQCRLVSAEAPDEIEVVAIATHTGRMVAQAQAAYDIPAKPAYDTYPNGPLLAPTHMPATPARHVDAVAETWAGRLTLGEASWVNDNTASDNQPNWDVFLSYLTAQDLVLQVPTNARGIYADLGENVQFLMRKKDQSVVFILESMTTPSSTLQAGYCYPPSNP